MLAVEELHAKAAGGRPMLVFNGELDRIRSGYYPAFFYPKIGKCAKNFLPGFDQASPSTTSRGPRAACCFALIPARGRWVVREKRDKAREAECACSDAVLLQLRVEGPSEGEVVVGGGLCDIASHHPAQHANSHYG